MTTGSLVTNQQFLIARLADFCNYGQPFVDDADPWVYMRDKLREIESPIGEIKQAQLLAARDRFVKLINDKNVGDSDIVEFKTVLSNYLSPGEYADVAIHLDLKVLANPDQCTWVLTMMTALKAFSIFDEEKKPEEVRFKGPKKKVLDMTYRLRLDVMEKILTRKPVTNKRKHIMLRGLRRRVAEFCTVLHLPKDAQDTLSPFMLIQVEALAVALLRFMTRFR